LEEEKFMMLVYERGSNSEKMHHRPKKCMGSHGNFEENDERKKIENIR